MVSEMTVDGTLRRGAPLAIGILLALSCKELPMLEANQQTMRTVLERRGAYAKSLPAHVSFLRYFQAGIVDGVKISTVEAGTLRVPSGEILVADPFYFTADFTHPLRRRTPPGHYPIVLAVADLGGWGNRVAFASLRLSSAEVQTWELAETTDPGQLNVFFGVDAGMACFADAEAAGIFARVQREFDAQRPKGNYYEEVLIRDIPDDSNWGEHHPDPASPLGVIITRSGLGDGLYSAYWGLDSDGAPAQLVVDFQLFDQHGTIFRRH